MKITKILSIFALNISLVYASGHVSNCPDEAFIQLGKAYPSVGSISFNQNPLRGSGTLIDLKNSPGLENFSHLQGRVVMTAAHLFDDFPDANALPDTYFSVKKGESTQASVYPHKGYIESNTQYEVGFSFLDIAILILKNPITDVKGEIVDITSPYDALMNKTYASVGFGSTGHLLSPYSIYDDKKRGSFAYADKMFNNRLRSEFITIKDDLGHDQQIPSGHTPGAILELQCYMDSPFLSQQSTLQTYKTPSGVTQGGDSGGGVFDDLTKNLVAVISYGCSNRIEKTKMIEREVFNQHKEFFENNLKKAQQEYDEKIQEVQSTLTQSEFLAFQKENPRPTMPQTVEKSMFDTLMNDRSSLEEILNIGQLAINSNVVISFHKDWIVETLSQIQE